VSYSLFAVEGTRWLKQNGQERGRIKEKERCYPIYPWRKADPLRCFSLYKDARRDAREKRAFVILNDASSKDRVPPLLVQRGLDRGVLIAKTTMFKQSWNGAKKLQLHAIGNSHERASTVAAFPL